MTGDEPAGGTSGEAGPDDHRMGAGHLPGLEDAPDEPAADAGPAKDDHDGDDEAAGPAPVEPA